MDKPLIVLTSVTHAMKGKSLLLGYGIFSEIVRTPKGRGVKSCGYSLKVPQRTDEAQALLEENGIVVLGRLQGDVK
ncbi:MAG: DUF3343 domain-containing protein [Acutalibacteraceae bacterium]